MVGKTHHSFPCTTAEFAALNGVLPHSVLQRVQHSGSYHGVVPLRLVNRRLMWPAIQVVATKVTEGEGGGE